MKKSKRIKRDSPIKPLLPILIMGFVLRNTPQEKTRRKRLVFSWGIYIVPSSHLFSKQMMSRAEEGSRRESAQAFGDFNF
ncbi:MAG: hypothetical protein Q7S34_03165 [bacterium]|nr:hypothetical protein [bacterium]